MQKKDSIQLGVTAVLLVVLIFAVSNAAKKASQRKTKQSAPQAVVLTGVSVDQAIKIDSRGLYNALEQQAKLIDLKRDPFTAAPITSEKALQSGVDLTGILWDKDKPLAIIDGEIVKVGSTIAGKTIMEIKKNSVILSDGKVLTELKLQQ